MPFVPIRFGRVIGDKSLQLIWAILFGLGLTCSTLIASAQAQLPPAMLGMWAPGDCVGDEDFIVFTGPTIAGFRDGLMIRFDDGDIETLTYQTKEAAGGWIAFQTERLDIFVKLENGQIRGANSLPPDLRQAEPENEATAEPTQPETSSPSPTIRPDGPDGGADGDTPEAFRELQPLTKCAQAPARWQVPHGEVLSFIAAQPTLESRCDGTDLAKCLSALLDYGDLTNNGELSEAEMTRMLRTLVHFSALIDLDLSEDSTSIDEGDVLAAVAGTSAIGLAISKGLVLSFDFDASGGLSREEFAQDRRIAPNTSFDTDILRDLRDGIDDGFDTVIDLLEDLFDGLSEQVALPPT